MQNYTFARLAGMLALVAAPSAWLSLVIGLLAVDWNFETFGDPPALLALGAPAAQLIGWSYTLNAFGAYLLLIPLLIWLYHELKPQAPLFMQWYVLCGLGYLVLGAAGGAILASAWPALMTAYPTASAADQATLTLLFDNVVAIAEGGLQGVIQNVAGGVWWLGLSTLIWAQRRALAGLSGVIGAALLLNAVGNLIDSEALSTFGLIATLLLVPIWTIWMGLAALRQGR